MLSLCLNSPILNLRFFFHIFQQEWFHSSGQGTDCLTYEISCALAIIKSNCFEVLNQIIKSKDLLKEKMVWIISLPILKLATETIGTVKSVINAKILCQLTNEPFDWRHKKIIGLHICNKMLSFNLKCGYIAVIFSDEIIFTVDAVEFVEMIDTWQSY